MKRILTEKDLREVMKQEILELIEEKPEIVTFMEISEETGFSLLEVEEIMEELETEGSVEIIDIDDP